MPTPTPDKASHTCLSCFAGDTQRKYMCTAYQNFSFKVTYSVILGQSVAISCCKVHAVVLVVDFYYGQVDFSIPCIDLSVFSCHLHANSQSLCLRFCPSTCIWDLYLFCRTTGSIIFLLKASPCWRVMHVPDKKCRKKSIIENSNFVHMTNSSFSKGQLVNNSMRSIIQKSFITTSRTF